MANWLLADIIILWMFDDLKGAGGVREGLGTSLETTGKNGEGKRKALNGKLVPTAWAERRGAGGILP